MQLHQLKKTTAKKQKRLGRGYGSAKGGHTAGRGQKGQKSRSSVPIWFEGGQLPQIRRFPYIRGKSRFKSLKKEVVHINLNQLNQLKKNTQVNPKALVDAGLVKPKELERKHIKVLGRGKLEIPLTVKLDTSQSAKAKIEAAGGKVQSGQPA